MWQLYKATGEEIYRQNAEETEEKLDAALNNFWVMDHDSGFFHQSNHSTHHFLPCMEFFRGFVLQPQAPLS